MSFSFTEEACFKFLLRLLSDNIQFLKSSLTSLSALTSEITSNWLGRCYLLCLQMKEYEALRHDHLIKITHMVNDRMKQELGLPVFCIVLGPWAQAGSDVGMQGLQLM